MDETSAIGDDGRRGMSQPRHVPASWGAGFSAPLERAAAAIQQTSRDTNKTRSLLSIFCQPFPPPSGRSA